MAENAKIDVQIKAGKIQVLMVFNEITSCKQRLKFKYN